MLRVGSRKWIYLILIFGSWELWRKAAVHVPVRGGVVCAYTGVRSSVCVGSSGLHSLPVSHRCSPPATQHRNLDLIPCSIQLVFSLPRWSSTPWFGSVLIYRGFAVWAGHVGCLQCLLLPVLLWTYLDIHLWTAEWLYLLDKSLEVEFLD